MSEVLEGPSLAPSRRRVDLSPHLPALVPGLATIGLMVFWAVDDGGYGAATWYWGALVVLGLLACTAAALGPRLRLGAGRAAALGPLAAYVGWCYLSIAWAGSPGDALAGANQALLYLLVFAVMLVLPWTPEGALVAIVAFAVAVGVIAVVLLFRLAAADNVPALVVEGRLAAPTGYFNSTAALFTIEALSAITLSVRRELPGPLRGLLLAFACAGLQLAVTVQSRGWLFTLPLVALAAIVVVGDRLRTAPAAALAIAGVLVPVRRLLRVYATASGGVRLDHASARAGQAALLACAAVFFVGTLGAWADRLWPAPSLSPRARRRVGAALAGLALACLAGGAAVVTHGRPLHFLGRQLNGFSHVQTSFSTQSHFVDVGSGRYDFWRVSLGAFVAHPIGGLGEDNFADYYLTHRRTREEPSSPHSLELRLLAQTGIVGFLLFAGFLAAALRLAWAARRRHGSALGRAMAGAGLLALAVWSIHGSVDWFWEMPALSGPAFGLLGLSAGLAPAPRRARARRALRSRGPLLGWAAGGLALIAATLVLGLPFLSQREIALATDAAPADPATALRDLARAARLNPLDSLPGRLGGAIALSAGRYRVAEARFLQAVGREPQDWLSWLGAGLAESAIGHPLQAHHDFVIAHAIDSTEPATGVALRLVFTRHPLTWARARTLLVVVG